GILDLGTGIVSVLCSFHRQGAGDLSPDAVHLSHLSRQEQMDAE
ncbi:unnamed protein product, partial [Urochloa humidicola]